MKKIVLSIIGLLVLAQSPARSDNAGRNRSLLFAGDEELLTYVQRQYFCYIWDAALPQIREDSGTRSATARERSKNTWATTSARSRR